MFQKCGAAFVILWFGFVIPAFSSDPMEADGWKRVMDKNGIKSYSRQYQGTGIFEFKAVTVVDAPIYVVSELVREVETYTDWMPYCSLGSSMDIVSRDEKKVRIILDVPWPLSDREIIMHAKALYALDHGRAFIDLENVNAWPETDPGLVRVPMFSGHYTFEFITPDKTGVIYQYNVDLAGSLPDALSKMIANRFLFDKLSNMQKKAVTEKYIALGKKSPDKGLCDRILADRTRKQQIASARLAEIIQSKAVIDLMAGHIPLYDLITTQNGIVSQKLLYAWGSEPAKKEAVKILLGAYLASRTSDPAIVSRVLSDDRLIHAIQTGSAVDSRPARTVLEAYLKG
ncbi:MAG: START domain-containing protein [Thermodesulfobacteriota bacterium]